MSTAFKVSIQSWVTFLALVMIWPGPTAQASRDKSTCDRRQIEASNFDFDDNLFVTPARIAIWDNVNQAELEVSTAYWALIKGKIAKEGAYKDFVMRPNFLRDFSDSGAYGTKLFKNQIGQALKRRDVSWKGPRWDAFVDALSCPISRQYVTIITAREHSPESILAGLQLLKEKGLIPALPDIDHIYPVRWSGFPTQFKGQTDAESKAKVMEYLLDRLETQPISKDEKLHLWNFSDDDFDNFSQALETLSPQVRGGRWPHVKISLFFTGLNNPEHKPQAIVIN